MPLDLHTIAAFTLLWATCVPVPGANQLMVMHVALAHGRAQLVPALLGNVLAIVAMAGAALAGLAALLAATPGARLAIGVLGALTALSNSQAVIFITSVFAASGILDANLATGVTCLGIMGVMNAAWLGGVGTLLTFEVPRRIYARFRPRVELTVGVLFVGFGLRLLARELLPLLR